MSEVLAQLEKKGGGNEIAHYVTGYDGSSIGHSPTVDITQYKNILFILTQGANSQAYLRQVVSVTVEQFINNGYSQSMTGAGGVIKQTITYTNGTFNFPNATNGGSGTTVVLY